MINTLKAIKCNLQKIGITGKFIFCGSAVLKLYGLLDRKLTDIDLVLHTEDAEKVKALFDLFGTNNSSSPGNHYSLFLREDGFGVTHLDVFVNPTHKIDVFATNEPDLYLATPKHIIEKKQEYNRPKDRRDIEEIQLRALDALVLSRFN